MKPRKPAKLALRTETLRQLGREEAKEIVGGECTITDIIRQFCTLTFFC